MSTLAGRVVAIAIGRNEGERLKACLTSLQDGGAAVIYVDSGSTDGSVAFARSIGAEVVALDTSKPFTAARARNAGLAQLRARIAEGGAPAPDYVQFVDGDCRVQPGWIAAAVAFLDQTPAAAVACGRRRERFPEASVYNRLCDREWDTPIGRAGACGGDALMRLVALDAVGGYRDDLIAGEEPEMCVRLRAKGWEVWRLDVEMTEHDAAIHRFSQWWRRTRRAGHAFAEGAALHGASPARHFVPDIRRIILWGGAIPALILAMAAAMGPAGLALAAIYPVQIGRIALRDGAGDRAAWEHAFFVTVGKFPEIQGALQYWFSRLGGGKSSLIEYK